MSRRSTTILLSLLFYTFYATAGYSQASRAVNSQEIKTANTSSYVGNGRWDWTVYLVAPAEVLNNVSKVEYTLHPSFPKPVREVKCCKNSPTPFGLSSNGWGTFEIGVKIFFLNGSSKTIYHKLSLKKSAPATSSNITVNNISRQLGDDWWSWTVFITASNVVLDKVKCVEYTLHSSFRDPVQVICNRGSDSQAFPFSAKGWGTFKIKVRIIFKDGTTSNLTHDLRFG